jgi:hypothetical protein
MSTRWIVFLLAASLAVLTLDAATAQKKDSKAKMAFTDATQAGPDFAVQGEYEGEVAGQGKLGAQVVAQGDGRFAAQLLPGGLPGAGWNGKDKLEGTGQTEGGKTLLGGTNWKAEIANGKLTGQTDGRSFVLTQVLRKSPTLGARPPEGAVVLFNGSTADEWVNGKLVEGNLLHMGTTSKRTFRDFQLHLEFRLSFMPWARGQGRSNSGVYLQGRHEVQILDSFGLKGLNNECGGLYAQTAPSVNLCFPPLSWQTYDIDYKGARYDATGKKTANAVVSVRHNGVLIHDKMEFKGTTQGGQKEEDKPGPIFLQNHGGDPVYFRNIWVVETK